MSPSHIPAWKRLGLKLKYANDCLPTTDGEANSEPVNLKRKSQSEPSKIEDQDHTPKKIRTNGEAVLPEGSQTPQPKQRERKKSVSFASDTKNTDGDTAQTIQFATPGSPGSTPRPSKREKKPKSERGSGISSSPSLPKKSRDALEYLGQHFHDRSSWKFNKNREVWVLKHVLSTQDIPAEYNASLAGYVHGLKSTGARERLIKDCQKSLNTSENLTDSSDISEQDRTFTHRLTNDLGEGSLQRKLSDDATYTSWIKQQARAQLILRSLGQTFGVSGGSNKANGLVNPRVKKSKARTSRIEIESDSDSDSDSSSDSSSSSLKSADKSSNTSDDDIEDTSSSGTSSSERESTTASSDSASSTGDDGDSD